MFRRSNHIRITKNMLAVISLLMFLCNSILHPGYALGEQQIQDDVVLSKIVDSPVYSEIVSDTDVYSDADLNESVDEFHQGQKVEVIEDVLYQVYKVKDLEDGSSGYIPSESMKVYEDVYRKVEPFRTGELERAVELLALYSDTSYLLWCDIARQNLYVFLYENDKWNLIRQIPSATGRNISPTKRGFFSIYDKADWFYSNDYDSGAYNALMYDGAYYIHSIPVDWDGNVLEPELGEKVSAGCIRVSIPDSDWLYEYIPVNTAIWVN